jgi:hypothetical protein
MSAEHSRVVRLAAAATGKSEHELARHMSQTAVVVSLDPDVPGAIEVATTLVETLRRGPGHVYLDPRGVSSRTLEELIASADAVANSMKISTNPRARPHRRCACWHAGTDRYCHRSC